MEAQPAGYHTRGTGVLVHGRRTPSQVPSPGHHHSHHTMPHEAMPGAAARAHNGIGYKHMTALYT